MTRPELRPGSFDSRVQSEWFEDGRSMQLLRDLWYRDLSGRYWLAGKAAIVNGASIPRFFWRVIGSPFVGKYRRSSVIHDVYCVNQLRPYADVHAVFREMMLQDGVAEEKAETMYRAVLLGGPKW